MQQPELQTTDVSVVDNILNAVLSLMPIPDVSYVPSFMRNERISEALRGFNPETHVIVTKEQLDVTKQLQTLAALPLQMEQFKALQANISTKVDELHAVQTGALYKGKTRLTAKEKKAKEKDDFEQECRLILESWVK